MKTKQYTPLQVLFPPARAEILRLLFLPPQKERYVRELMGMSGLTLCAIQDELRKLSTLKLITSRSNGYHRFYRANQAHPVFADIVHLVQHSQKARSLDYSDLHRRKHARARQQREARGLPPDRPIKWDLFSKRRAT